MGQGELRIWGRPGSYGFARRARSGHRLVSLVFVFEVQGRMLSQSWCAERRRLGRGARAEVRLRLVQDAGGRSGECVQGEEVEIPVGDQARWQGRDRGYNAACRHTSFPITCKLYPSWVE